MHIRLEINRCTVWPNFKFIENIVIWEIILQEIENFISRKNFGILTFYALISNDIRVELHSLTPNSRIDFFQMLWLRRTVAVTM